MEALQRLHNRGSISTGYTIDNSLKLEADNTEYLSRTPSSNTNRQTWTFSTWVKRAELGQNARLIDVYVDGQNFTTFGFDTSDRLVAYAIDGGVDYGGHYSPRFRDTSAWYHIIWKSDITNATAANRWQIYVNGVEVTDKDIDYGTPPTNFFPLINITYSTKIGYNTDGSNPSSQYMAETHLIDGTALAPTDFGEFDEDSGIWKPKAYEGTYGTNGFYLDFESSGSLGADSSGNGNNFTLNNITSADQATDTPTNNFCTLNPLWTFGNTMGVSDGGTKVNNTVIAWGGAKGSIGVNSGKWYWEHGSFSGNDTMFGIQNQAGGGNTQAYLDPYTLAIQANSNVIQFTDPSNRTEAFTKTFSITDIWGVALDLDANTIAFYRNGSIVNSAFSIDGLIGNGEFFPFVTHYGSGLNSRVNFGGYTGITISSAASDENGYGTFEYAPPSGYYALCTKNLAEYG